MKKFDKRAQMMDAGCALFESKDGMGTALGQVKAEMKEYGEVSETAEVALENLPHSTDKADFVLDFSSFWRNRYVSCLVQDAGDTGRRTPDGEPIRLYAAVFKEGNKGTRFRDFLYVVVLLYLFVDLFCFTYQLISILCGTALILLVTFSWICPSRSAQRTVKEIIANLSK